MWLYNEKELYECDIPDNVFGFVYRITHIPTKKFYIGKKQMFSTLTKKIGKRELETIRQGRKDSGVSGRLPVKKKVIKESDWKSYFGSNSWIKSKISEGYQSEFVREIIKFCISKKQLTYWELVYQIKYDVLNNELSLNDNILGKFFRKDI